MTTNQRNGRSRGSSKGSSMTATKSSFFEGKKMTSISAMTLASVNNLAAQGMPLEYIIYSTSDLSPNSEN